MNEQLQKLLKKVNIFKITLLVVLIVIAVVGIYYITLFIPSNVKIQNAEVLNEEIYIQKITEGKYITQIEMKIVLNPENLQNYRNYVIGEGQGYYINYQIILKDGEKQQKIRTIFSDISEGQATIIGYVYNNVYNKKDFEIGILQKNYKDGKEINRFGIINEQVGETNENKI